MRQQQGFRCLRQKDICGVYGQQNESWDHQDECDDQIGGKVRIHRLRGVEKGHSD